MRNVLIDFIIFFPTNTISSLPYPALFVLQTKKLLKYIMIITLLDFHSKASVREEYSHLPCVKSQGKGNYKRKPEFPIYW